MRWESTETTCQVTVYVPSASPGREPDDDGSSTLGRPSNLGGVVVEHPHRTAGQGHRLAEPQHDLGRRGVDDLAVGRRDLQQLRVRRHETGRSDGGEEDDGEGGERGEQPLTGPGRVSSVSSVCAPCPCSQPPLPGPP